MRPTLLLSAAVLVACGDDIVVDPPVFEVVVADVPEAILDVSGTSARDVWAVGADRGRGPLVLHYDGGGWTRLETGSTGALWWVHPVPGGDVFFGGESETVLRYDGSRFERLLTPGVARHTVFGVWGESSSDVWAVGAVTGGRSGFVWRWDGAAWRELRLPADVPRDGRGELPGFFKVWGDGDGTVWVVGGAGTVVRFDEDGEGESGYLTFERGPSAETRLQWATYFDAADQAGQSRIWGGIHVSADDFAGRRIGSQVGLAAIERVQQLF